MSENFVGFVTSRDIMEATGITNVATLVRWHSVEKLIPPPEIRRHPGGRGNMAYWPQWVLPYCQHVIQLKKSGKLLAEIRETLGQNWEQAAESYGRVAKQYKYSRESKRMAKGGAMFALNAALFNELKEWQDRLNATISPHTENLTNQDIIDRAVAMVEAGVNPVLIITKTKLIVSPDFAVSNYLSQCRSSTENFLVVPIWNDLVAQLRNLLKVPEAPSVKPSTKVVVEDGTAHTEQEVHMFNTWEFEIKRKRRPKKKK